MPDIPCFIDPEKSPQLDLVDGIVTTILTGTHGEKMMMVRQNIAAGAVAPMQAHPQEQVGLVLEGEGILTIGDEERRVKRGDYYCMPANVPHGAVNPGQTEFVAVEIFYPIREDFLKKIK